MNPSGAQRSWTRLLDGQCGIVSLAGRGKAHAQQQCQVAALVPRGKKEDGGWTAGEWLTDDVRQLFPDRVALSMVGEKDDDVDTLVGAAKNVNVHAVRYPGLTRGSPGCGMAPGK